MTIAKAYASVAAGLQATYPIDPNLPQEMIACLEKIDQRLDGKILVKSLVLEKGFWYLASPYAQWAGGHDDAFQHAAAIAARVLLKGVYVMSPIAHSHPLANAMAEGHSNHDIWMPLDEQFVRAAFGVIVAGFPGWDKSKGVTMEIRWAKEQGKAVWLMSPEDLSITPL